MQSGFVWFPFPVASFCSISADQPAYQLICSISAGIFFYNYLLLPALLQKNYFILYIYHILSYLIFNDYSI